MASRIVATFTDKRHADEAVKALKDIGIEPGADLPENGGNPIIVAAPATSTGGTTLGAVPAAVVGGDNAVEEVDDSRHGDITVSVSVKDDAEADKAMAVLREHGATINDSVQSTIDEVANPAQAPDRLR
jgi:hypothetical protein